MCERLDEKYSNLSVYSRIKNDMRSNSWFFNRITNSKNNRDKSSDAKESIAFVAWYLLHKFVGMYSSEMVANHIVDGKDDKKIDAYYLVRNKLFLIQAKWTQYPLGPDDIKEMETLWEELSDKNGFEGCNEQVSELIPLIKMYLNDENCQIELILVSPTDLTNGGPTENEDWLNLKNKIEQGRGKPKFILNYNGIEELRSFSMHPYNYRVLE